jgi:two-component system sensor histidine kinase KdpD
MDKSRRPARSRATLDSVPERPFVLIRNLAFSLALVAATTVVCSRILTVNATSAGFAYLLNVLAIATAWGLVEAVIASVAAMLCFNFFFLPPIGQFTIADPQNWVALVAFLVTALVASHLSNREKRQAADAQARQRETEQLYALSRFILLTNPSESVGRQAAQHIAEVFECRAVALYNAQTGELFKGGPEDLPQIEAKLMQVVSSSSVSADPGVSLAPVVLGGRPIGALALRGLSLSDGALQALLNLVAIALERVRTVDAASRAEAARQSEEFKSTLLDAIAHEFKTPLTSLKAASTALLSDDAAGQGVSGQTRELASIINEETDRLDVLVTEAVRMAQIDAGTIRLDREPLGVKDLLDRVMAHFAAKAEGREVRVEVGDNLPHISADRDLIAMAVRQLVDNALKYSPPGSPLGISATMGDHRVTITVRDQGPGVPASDRERIFEKFYRRPDARRLVPGAGLGLYIAREIARAHGGDITIEGASSNGSEFRVSLPPASLADSQADG